jgi:hypothetical protein
MLVDRDENAALNIVGAGLRFSPKGVANEAVKGNPKTVILRADATQSTHHPKSQQNRYSLPLLTGEAINQNHIHHSTDVLCLQRQHSKMEKI